MRNRNLWKFGCPRPLPHSSLADAGSEAGGSKLAIFYGRLLWMRPTLFSPSHYEYPNITNMNHIFQPHVRVWNCETFETLAVLGLGNLQRGVGSVSFSPVSVLVSRGARQSVWIHVSESLLFRN